MNILVYSSKSVYNTFSFGGAETSLKLIAEKFAEAGHEVIYLTHFNPEKNDQTFEVVNGVGVYYFRPLKWPTPKGLFFPDLKHKFIRRQLLSFIAGIVKKNKIDLVHTYNEYPNTFDILEVKEKFNLEYKVVLRIAGLFWKIAVERNPELKPKISKVLNEVDAVNLLSESFLELFNQELEKGNWDFNNKIIIQDIGFNSTIFDGRWQLEKEKKLKLLMVARFSNYQKRQDILIEALSKTKNSNVHLTFIGSGETKERCVDLVDKLNLHERVKFIDEVTQEEIKKYYLEADINCLATEFEGVPKSLIEAMSMGVPGMVSDVLPLNGYIIEGENGFLVKNSADEWAAKIDEIAEDRDKLKHVSENSIVYVNKNFNPNENILLYTNNFLEIVNE